MDFANQPAFPVPSGPSGLRGMTYRQWLVGKLLEGGAVRPESTQNDRDIWVKNALKLADAAIKSQS